jgi:hypothetical protein
MARLSICLGFFAQPPIRKGFPFALMRQRYMADVDVPLSSSVCS